MIKELDIFCDEIRNILATQTTLNNLTGIEILLLDNTHQFTCSLEDFILGKMDKDDGLPKDFFIQILAKLPARTYTIAFIQVNKDQEFNKVARISEFTINKEFRGIKLSIPTFNILLYFLKYLKFTHIWKNSKNRDKKIDGYLTKLQFKEITKINTETIYIYSIN